ncbi:hypothetical protein So717_36400 [Roseobacter cerasinus]|uniref:Porin n=1 Tax=Roseobacter cerasinus TaxID=2602289 RepID=A0A640VVK2_9RHOB|nr:hypothetical protein [Roseobacter cerasinus]GFE51887.1 hypothetical protein So717_36400 [Roseobacter cerasinus]
MASVRIIRPAAALSLALALPAGADTFSLDGFVGIEARNFLTFDGEPRQIYSLTGEIRSGGALTDSLSYDLRLYGRTNLDGLDGSYIDPTIAKLTWQRGNWQIDAGYDLVFWGVAEGRNVVNVINQRDQIRDQFFDQGLGQRMIAVRYFAPSVTVEAFVLPGFEELDFGATGRTWGLGLPVDDSRSTFEASDGADHTDFALRLSGGVGNLEYGIFAFDGTLRQPEFQVDTATNTLIPNYVQGEQIGAEAQYTTGPLLYKFEGVKVWPDSDSTYWSAILGVEYIIGDIIGIPSETSLFAEYYHDSRRDDPSVAFENDIFLGTQFRLSNTFDTEIELGVIIDTDDGDFIGSFNVSSRISDNLRASFEYIYADASDQSDGLFNSRDIDQLFVSLEWYF